MAIATFDGVNFIGNSLKLSLNSSQRVVCVTWF